MSDERKESKFEPGNPRRKESGMLPVLLTTDHYDQANARRKSGQTLTSCSAAADLSEGKKKKIASETKRHAGDRTGSDSALLNQGRAVEKRGEEERGRQLLTDALTRAIIALSLTEGRRQRRGQAGWYYRPLSR